MTQTITPARVVESSENRKLGPISATYLSQASCPVSCPFFGQGCYANSGRMGIHTNRLNKSPIVDELVIAQMEANGIGKLSGYRPLRLCVVGDHKSNETASIAALAADKYTRKHGMPVFTYTHAWRDVDKSSWGNISVLASCESIDQVREARAKGYATAMVVEEFEKDTAYKIADDLVGIPCPEMTGKAESCDACQLCMNAGKLHAGGKVILFAAHGASKTRVINQLNMVN